MSNLFVLLNGNCQKTMLSVLEFNLTSRLFSSNIGFRFGVWRMKTPISQLHFHVYVKRSKTLFFLHILISPHQINYDLKSSRVSQMMFSKVKRPCSRDIMKYSKNLGMGLDCVAANPLFQKMIFGPNSTLVWSPYTSRRALLVFSVHWNSILAFSAFALFSCLYLYLYL